MLISLLAVLFTLSLLYSTYVYILNSNYKAIMDRDNTEITNLKQTITDKDNYITKLQVLSRFHDLKDLIIKDVNDFNKKYPKQQLTCSYEQLEPYYELYYTLETPTTYKQLHISEVICYISELEVEAEREQILDELVTKAKFKKLAKKKKK